MSEREITTLAGGCFWCLEAVYDDMEGVLSVESGYMGGRQPNPAYRDVCTGRTGHAEVVQLTFDPGVTTFEDILEVFFAIHDPTSMDRQGNDAGEQYRSVIFYHSPEQQAIAEESKIGYQKRLAESGYGEITTEIVPATEFYFAEDYHQQYLSEKKNPYGYCPDHGTGVACPVGLAIAPAAQEVQT